MNGMDGWMLIEREVMKDTISGRGRGGEEKEGQGMDRAWKDKRWVAGHEMCE